MERNRLLISPEDDFAYGAGVPRDATWRNLVPAAELGLSIAPGSGEAMALRDSWSDAGKGADALAAGQYGDAAGNYANALLALGGAIPGAGIIARGTKRGAAWMDRNLPEGFNRLLDAAMPSDPKNTTFSGAGPTAKKAVSLQMVEDAKSGHKTFHLVQDGKTIGKVQAHLDETGDMHINNIAGFDGDKWTDFKALSNKVGTKGMLQVRNELQRLFPDIKTFSGDRVGGARATQQPYVKIKADSRS